MIVVVGASGTLGRLLVARLGVRGEAVRAVARHLDRSSLPDDVDGLELDITSAEGAAAAVRGARVIVSAITGFASPEGVEGIDAEGNRHLAQAAAAEGVEHFVLLSVARAAADHPIPLFRAKWAAEQALQASGVPWTIVRPTAYLETWLGLVGAPLVTQGKTMVFGSGRNPINFVSARDVAAVVERVIVDPGYLGRVVDIPGPENLTLEELATVAGSAAGRRGRVSHLPRVAMRVLSIALRPVDATRAGQIATALVMDTRSMAVDPATRSIPDLPMTRAADVAGQLFGPNPTVAMAS
jgi:uncharacterized protein YbjT (DUF2867 family)